MAHRRETQSRETSKPKGRAKTEKGQSPKRSGRSRRKTFKLQVGELARVEGEGGLKVQVRGDRVTGAELRIFEPPRFFEGFLEGRDYTEPPDLTARICGICPVAYQMSSALALEQVCGVEVDGPLRLLRRLLYCGEWMESHALHIHLLHAPDFLGYESGIALSADHPEAVQRGLEMKKTGNRIMELLGGRAVHPVNVRLGGFYRVPAKAELEALRGELERGRDLALETVRWVGGLPFPALEGDWELVALSHPEEYAIDRGRIVSDRGLDIPVSEFSRHFAERHVARSNALQGVRKRASARGPGSGRMPGAREVTGTPGARRADAAGEPYLVGPLARYSLNFRQLSPLARQAAEEAGLGPECRNPFRSIVVRAVELLYAFDEALRLMDLYEQPEPPAVAVVPRAGEGHGATEAPRGLLYHSYRLDGAGKVLSARIVPPTAQNQRAVEADLARVVEESLQLPKDELTWRCEQTVRNYDPCISCATHFLKLEIVDDEPHDPESQRGKGWG